MKNNWFNRLFNAKMRCEKFGHKEHQKIIRIRKRADWPCVVEDFKAVAIECTRCGELLAIQGEEIIEGFTGCEMPNKYWSEIRENGYTIIER